jgi:sec-independent protein translocase protein TatB
MPEFFLVLLVAVLVLGPKQLPMAAKQLGRFVARIKRFYQQYRNEFDQMIKLSELQNNIARAEQAEKISLKTAEENSEGHDSGK